jgi:tetratricopeptide (TPR) repeat protein
MQQLQLSYSAALVMLERESHHHPLLGTVLDYLRQYPEQLEQHAPMLNEIAEAIRIRDAAKAGAAPQESLQRLMAISSDEEKPELSRMAELMAATQKALKGDEVWTTDTYVQVLEGQLCRPSEYVGGFAKLALRLYVMGERERAQEMLERAVRKFPEFAQAFREEFQCGVAAHSRALECIAEAKRRLQAAPAPAATRPGTVWGYWEDVGGRPRPAFIAACQDTIRAHGLDVRILSPAEFEEIRGDQDRDIDLSRLSVEHRADYIRAFLLKERSGLWLDSDCIVLRSLEPLLDRLEECDFLAYFDRTNYPQNNLLGSRPGSVTALAFYLHIVGTLRSEHRYADVAWARSEANWDGIGGDVLAYFLWNTEQTRYLLPWNAVLPVIPPDFKEVLYARGTPEQHAVKWDPEMVCMMLSYNWLRPLEAENPGGLMAPDSFFRYLVDRSLAEARR